MNNILVTTLTLLSLCSLYAMEIERPVALKHNNRSLREEIAQPYPDITHVLEKLSAQQVTSHRNDVAVKTFSSLVSLLGNKQMSLHKMNCEINDMFKPLAISQLADIFELAEYFKINLFALEALKRGAKLCVSNPGEEVYVMLPLKFLIKLNKCAVVTFRQELLQSNYSIEELLRLGIDIPTDMPKRLDLKGFAINNLDGIAKVMDLDTISDLYCGYNHIDLRRYQLTSKSLEFWSLESNGLHELPPFGELPALEHLNLSNNNITKLDPAVFTHLTSLKFLNLSNNKLTSARNLVLPLTLKRVNLTGNPITQEEIDQLQSRLPHTRIVMEAQ